MTWKKDDDGLVETDGRFTSFVRTIQRGFSFASVVALDDKVIFSGEYESVSYAMHACQEAKLRAVMLRRFDEDPPTIVGTEGWIAKGKL